MNYRVVTNRDIAGMTMAEYAQYRRNNPFPESPLRTPMSPYDHPGWTSQVDNEVSDLEGAMNGNLNRLRTNTTSGYVNPTTAIERWRQARDSYMLTGSQEDYDTMMMNVISGVEGYDDEPDQDGKPEPRQGNRWRMVPWRRH